MGIKKSVRDKNHPEHVILFRYQMSSVLFSASIHTKISCSIFSFNAIPNEMSFGRCFFFIEKLSCSFQQWVANPFLFTVFRCLKWMAIFGRCWDLKSNDLTFQFTITALVEWKRICVPPPINNTIENASKFSVCVNNQINSHRKSIGMKSDEIDLWPQIDSMNMSTRTGNRVKLRCHGTGISHKIHTGTKGTKGGRMWREKCQSNKIRLIPKFFHFQRQFLWFDVYKYHNQEFMFHNECTSIRIVWDTNAQSQQKISQFCQFDALIKTVKKSNWWKNVHHSPFFSPLLILTMAKIRCPTVYTKGRKNRLAMGNCSIFVPVHSFLWLLLFHSTLIIRIYVTTHNLKQPTWNIISFTFESLFFAFFTTFCVRQNESTLKLLRKLSCQIIYLLSTAWESERSLSYRLCIVRHQQLHFNWITA